MTPTVVRRPRTVALSVACAAVVLTATTSPAAAAMPPLPTGGLIEVDCSQGPVDLWETTGQYVLKGRCSTVIVRSAGISIYLEYADAVEMRADGISVHADDLGRLVVDGSNIRADVSGRVGRLRVTSLGAVNRVRIGSGRLAKIAGSSNKVRYTRLGRLVVRGQQNRVVVAKGSTRVSVGGTRNVVRAHRR